jgi:hypothetical protein
MSIARPPLEGGNGTPGLTLLAAAGAGRGAEPALALPPSAPPPPAAVGGSVPPTLGTAIVGGACALKGEGKPAVASWLPGADSAGGSVAMPSSPMGELSDGPLPGLVVLLLPFRWHSQRHWLSRLHWLPVGQGPHCESDAYAVEAPVSFSNPPHCWPSAN